MNPQSFLIGCLSIVMLCAPRAIAQDPATRARIDRPDARDLTRPPRAAIFRAAGFPTVDAQAIPDAVLDDALRDLPADVLGSEAALREKLLVRAYDVLVLPYGSAFPVAAWVEIRAFLERGGGLVVLGGAPFHQPVRAAETPSSWTLLSRQPTFARELLIGPAERIAIDRGAVRPAAAAPWAAMPRPSAAWALTVRFTTKKDFEKEDGTSGPRDAVLRPLAHVVVDGVPIACPLLEIDRLRGPEAGARWVLAPSDATLDAPTIRACVARALEGAFEMQARPVHASIRPGDAATIRVLLHRPRTRAAGATSVVTVAAANGAAVDAGMAGTPDNLHGVATLPPETKPGLHVFDASCDRGGGTIRGGYVVRDDALLAAGPKISVTRDWITKDDRPFPIVGTTYMASDVHRKFLFEPEPSTWDRDFADMKRHGVNFVRTGLWNSWSRTMLDPGAIDESFLSALDAWVQIAASHGIVTCFNFFAFQPPVFGGTNPYLDPRALEGQKALLTAVARRFRGCGWVHYDLINEPSYCPADQLWTNRPIGDEWEKRAWTDWVIAHLGDDPLVLRDRWLDGGAAVLDLPKADELAYAMLREHRRPRKARDFVRFSNAVVAQWAADLRATLRAAGGDVLVTLGQDEGGTHVRPSQQLYAPSVDYTAVHTWWNNDDLLWDGVLTKVPEKPSLIQETGLMRLEDESGNPWRSPEDAARLLERKFAYSFMARGCGAVEWAWNINPYMPIENEAAIGLFRPDGTAKPELRVMTSFSRFFADAAPHLADFEPDPVVMVIPHSRIFAGRPRSAEPTRQLVRVLAERLGVVPTALSEFALTPERLASARLVLIPCPEAIDPTAMTVLRDASRRGVKVLITGALDRSRPVALREPTPWGATDATPAWVTFDGGQSEWLRCEDGPPLTRLEGAWWREPLPLELARESEPLVLLLTAATEAAEVNTHPSATPIGARVLLTPAVALVIVVNESSRHAIRRVTIDGAALDVPVEAGRARLAIVDRPSARILAATGGGPITKAR